MWPIGVLRTLRNCSSSVLHFKIPNENVLRLVTCKKFSERKYVSSVCRDFSYSRRRCVVLQRMLLSHLKHFTSTRGMAVDVESISPPYEYMDPKSEEEVVNVTFLYQDGTEQKVRGKIGDNLLLLAQRHGVSIEGACEAQLACTTCHVYVDDKYSEFLEEKSEEEDDLLDSAHSLKENSRLGCQIILKKELDGLKLTVPRATVNFYVDGHVPKH